MFNYFASLLAAPFMVNLELKNNAQELINKIHSENLYVLIEDEI